MKFATSALSVVVLLFAVSQASIIPAEQLDGNDFSECIQKYQSLLTEYSNLEKEARQQMIDCFQDGTQCFKHYAPIMAAINQRMAAVDAKISYCLQHGGDSEPEVSTSTSSTDSPATEDTTDSTSTSSPTGPVTITDCLNSYQPLIADLTSKEKAAFNQMVDCMTSGNSHALCSNEYEPTVDQINSSIAAVHQKFTMCLEEAESDSV
uniref:Protein TsetseEP domain-containing protein n=1 Tax=Bactrocera dorsalis TaxID=27457 RepID=A0A034W348_BACDO